MKGKQKNPLNLSGVLLYVFRKKKLPIIIVILGSISISLATSRIPIAISNCMQSNLFLISLAELSLCYITRAIFKLLRNHFSALLGSETVNVLRYHCTDLFVLNDADTSHEYTLLTYDVECFSGIISQQSLSFFESISVLLLSLSVIIADNVYIFLAILIECVLIVIISLVNAKHIAKYMKLQRNQVSRISSIVNETTTIQKLIRTFNLTEKYKKLFGEENRMSAELDEKFSNCKSRYSLFMELVELLSYFICIVATSTLVINFQLPVGSAVKYYGYMAITATASKSFAAVIFLFLNSKQSVIRIKESLNIPNVQQKALNDTEDTIICTARDGKEYVFKRGEITCIKGKSGSGKTTLIEGIISGGNEYYSVTYPKGIHFPCGYSPQKTSFFEGDIEYNITLGNKKDPSKYNRTISVCFVDEIIAKHGKNDINSDDVQLSGGEQQRICLARAIYNSAEIIIIDDSITAIDVARRNQIIEHLVGCKSKHYIILVSNYNEIEKFCDIVYEINRKN